MVRLTSDIVFEILRLKVFVKFLPQFSNKSDGCGQRLMQILCEHQNCILEACCWDKKEKCKTSSVLHSEKRYFAIWKEIFLMASPCLFHGKGRSLETCRNLWNFSAAKYMERIVFAACSHYFQIFSNIGATSVSKIWHCEQSFKRIFW